MNINKELYSRKILQIFVFLSQSTHIFTYLGRREKSWHIQETKSRGREFAGGRNLSQQEDAGGGSQHDAEVASNQMGKSILENST